METSDGQPAESTLPVVLARPDFVLKLPETRRARAEYRVDQMIVSRLALSVESPLLAEAADLALFQKAFLSDGGRQEVLRGNAIADDVFSTPADFTSGQSDLPQLVGSDRVPGLEHFVIWNESSHADETVYRVTPAGFLLDGVLPDVHLGDSDGRSG